MKTLTLLIDSEPIIVEFRRNEHFQSEGGTETWSYTVKFGALAFDEAKPPKVEGQSAEDGKWIEGEWDGVPGDVHQPVVDITFKKRLKIGDQSGASEG